MSLILSIIIVLLGCLIISFVVFGGAQMFIPYFKILLVNILKVSQNDWGAVLSIANSTPGVFGLKVSFASGYLAAQGHWLGFILMFFSYAIFIIVPIVVMLFVMKKYNQFKSSKFMVSFLKLMKPTIAGILLSIVVNLWMSLIVPFVGFNDLGTNFGELDNYFHLQDTFFKQWRYWVLLAWTFVSIPVDMFVIKKFKINIIYLIIANIALCMVLFEPWLN